MKLMYDLRATALAFILIITGATSGLAQVWNSFDVGYQEGDEVGATISTTPNSHLISGGGIGVKEESDGFRLLSQQSSGNLEVDARLQTLQEEQGAEAGVMIRESTEEDAPFAFVAINDAGELRFKYRSNWEGMVITSLGTVVPEGQEIWLRLVRSGNTISGYYSENGVNWSPVGSGDVPMTGVVQAGLAVSSGDPTSLVDAEFDHVLVVGNVPQRQYVGSASGSALPASIKLWLRADWSVVFDEEGRVSKWEDFSGYANDAIGSGGPSAPNDNRPLIIRDAIGIKPAMKFDNDALSSLANRKFLSVANHVNLNPDKISIFVVAKWPENPSGPVGFISKGGSTAGYTLGFYGGSPRFFIPPNAESWVATLTADQPYLVEGIFRTSAPNTGLNLRVNAQLSPLPLAQRTSIITASPTAPLFIGQYLTAPTNQNPSSTQVYPFVGEIAEILVYGNEVSEGQRLEIEAYLKGKYQLDSMPVPKALAPEINLAPGIYTSSQTINMSAVAGGLVYYQIDGGPAQLYTGEFTLSEGATSVTAWVEKPGHVNSDPVTTPIIVESTTDYVARNGLKLWLRADAGLKELEDGEIEEWHSQIPGYVAKATSAGRPTLLTTSTAGINGQPALQFNQDWLRVTTPLGHALALNKHTICVVARASSSTTAAPTGSLYTLISRLNSANGYLMGLKATPGTSSDVLLQLRSRLVFNSQTTDTELLTPSAVPLAPAQWNVLLSSFDLQKWSLQLSGKERAKRDRTVQVGDSGTDLFIGAQALNTGLPVNPFNGDIAEILVYDRDLDAKELRELGVYLNDRYQIPATDLKPVVDLQINLPGGLYPSEPILECSSLDDANITFRINDDDNNDEERLYNEVIDLSHETGVIIPPDAKRYTVKVTASKRGFTSITKTVTYFVDSATADVPKENLKLWLRADVAVTVGAAPNRLISNWNDVSGKANHLTTTQLGLESPRKILNVIGSRPAISFGSTGVSQMVATGAANQGLGLGEIPNNDVTVLAVVKDNGSPDDAVVLEQETVSDSAGFSLRLRQEADSQSSAVARFNDSLIKAVQYSGQPYLLPTGFNLFVQRAYPTTPKKHVLTVNRTGTVTQLNYAADTSSTARLFSLGSRRNAEIQDPLVSSSMPTHGFNGEIAELLIFDTVLSDLEMARLEAYLANRYSLNTDSRVPLPQLAEPSATPETGIWGANTAITATHTEPQVTLKYRYELGTAEPTSQDWVTYNNEPFLLEEDGEYTIQVMAEKPGFASSIKTFSLVIDSSTDRLPRQGLVSWLATNMGVETELVSGLERINRWRDLSGNGADALPLTTGTRPNLIQSTLIEYTRTDSSNVRIKAPVINFPNADRRLRITNVPSLANPQMTAFVVSRSYNTTTDRAILQKPSSVTSSSEGGWTLSYQDAPGKVGLGSLVNFSAPALIAGPSYQKATMVTGAVGTGLQVLGKTNEILGGGWNPNTPNIGDDLYIGGSERFSFTGTISAGSFFMNNISPSAIQRLAVGMSLTGSYVNGFKINAITGSTSIEMSDNNVGVGSTGTFTATSYMQGEIAEILLYSRYLSAEEINAVQSYLVAKYYFEFKTTLPAPVIQIGDELNSVGGVFRYGTAVTLRAEQGATIHYQVNGGEVYSVTGPFLVTVPADTNGGITNQTITTWCTKIGYAQSPKSEAKVIIDPNAELIPKGDLRLWVRGDSATTGSGTKVEKWLDLSGYGHHLTKPSATTVQAPDKVTSAEFNGQEVVQFSASSKTCLEGNYPGLDGENVSVFAVLRRSSTTSTATSIIAEKFATVSGGTAKGYTMQMVNSTNPKYTFRTLNVTAPYIVATDSGRPVTLIGGTHGDDSRKLYYQGDVKKTTVSGNEVIPAESSYFLIGGRKASYNFNGEIAELWVYNKELTQEEINSLGVYTYLRYGASTNKQVPAPRANFEGGTYSVPLGVILSSPLDGVTFRYELGGDEETEVPDPDSSSPIFNAATDVIPIPISVSGSYRVLKVKATKEGMIDSEVKTWVYRIEDDKIIVRDGLVAWFKGDRGVVADSNMRVTQWMDQSGMGNDAKPPVQTSLETKPLYVTDPLGASGVPVVMFNSAGSTLPLGLQIPHALKFPNSQINHFNNMSVVVVTRKLGTNNGLLLKKGGYQLRLAGSASVPLALVKANTPSISVPIRQNTFEVITGTYDQVALNISNSSILKSKVYSTALTQDTKPIYIGSTALTSAAANFQGEIAEIFIYNRGLSSGQRQQMEGYLQKQYGIISIPGSSLATPHFVPNGASPYSLGEPSKVAILGPSDLDIYYTTDPTLAATPSISWSRYVQQIQVNYTTTIWAFCRKEGLVPVNSDVESCVFELDAEKYPGPTLDPEDETPPVVTLEKPTHAIPVVTP